MGGSNPMSGLPGMGGGSSGNGQPQFVNQPNPQAGGMQYSYTPLSGANQPNSTANPLQPTFLGQATPNLFNAAQKYMPKEYFGNQAIYNPADILNAYTQNLPAFLMASKSMNQYQNPQEIQTPNPNYAAQAKSKFTVFPTFPRLPF